MLFGSNDVCRCRVRASDGELGSVCDLFFDERTWTIRHVVVNTGGWAPGNRVLVPRELFDPRDWSRPELEIPATRRELGQDALVQLPVPRTYQAKMRCRPSFLWTHGAGNDLARRSLDVLPEHLCSARELNGYRVEARDGRCGVVEGFLFEAEDWSLRHLVIGLGWLFAGPMLVPVSAITALDAVDEMLSLALGRDDVEHGPRLDSAEARLPSGAQLLVVRGAAAGAYGMPSLAIEA